ncbi:hexosaminidase D-like [Homalodisca vitripennis]|nr:hexosaminidase D-like [Homalodisca vitripennis]
MKLAGTYVGRLRLTVWRRKSTLLGAAMALALVVVCLQYNAAKEVVEVPPPPAAEETAEARANSVQFVANLPATGASLRTDSQGDLVDSAADANYVSGNLIYSGLDPKFNYVPPQRLVHLDLKGAPPKVPYLKRLLTLSREMGATGVLLEWEDMFPWSGELSPLAATNAYTRRDVDEIVETARSVHLEIIPLVQTFGHVEFALKHKEFTALREVPDSPQAICPSLNASVDLVYQMIDQMMAVHNNIRFLHIGCDEVFQMGECARCRTQTRDNLFLAHVSKVAQYVRSKYANVVPLIWDDMLRHLPPISLEQFRIGELVEPMVWVYAEDVYRFVPSSVWEKFAAIFPRVWAASAFKGAFGETLYVPNVKRHLENNLRWLQVMAAEGPKFKGGFQGIAVTGWQRYDHFSVLCELLPSAVPSLAINLLATSHGYFNQSLRTKLNTGLSCGMFGPSAERGMFLNLNNDPFLWDQFSRCAFPGHTFFKLLYRLNGLEREVSELVTTVRQSRGWMTAYNVRTNFSSPIRVDELMQDHPRLSHSLTALIHSAKDALAEVFDAYTVAEWIEQKLYPMVVQLEDMQKDATMLKSFRIWPKRPFAPLRDLERLGVPMPDNVIPPPG